MNTFKMPLIIEPELDAKLREYNVIPSKRIDGFNISDLHDQLLTTFLVDLEGYEYRSLAEVMSHIEESFRATSDTYHVMFYVTGEGRVAYMSIVGEWFTEMLYARVGIIMKGDGYHIVYDENCDSHF